MALMECPECKKEISDTAPTCPHCGAPVQRQKAEERPGDSGRMWALGIGALLLATAFSTCGKTAPQPQQAAVPPPQQNLATTVGSDTNESMAALINLNGCLCAEVTSVKKMSGKLYDVECIKYRGGTSKTSYVVNLGTGKVVVER